MGTDIQAIEALPQHPAPDVVATMTHSWRDLAKRPLMSKEERDRTALIIQKVSTPAAPKAIAVKVVPILTEYFVAMDQAGVAAQVGAIWQDELAEYPLWALHNATRWWLSRHNPDRRKKPLPGDISARCEVEMMLVRIAQRKVDSFDLNGPPPAPPEVSDEPPMTDEQRTEFEQTLSRFTAGRSMPGDQIGE